jgi:hypothetical protein
MTRSSLMGMVSVHSYSSQRDYLPTPWLLSMHFDGSRWDALNSSAILPLGLLLQTGPGTQFSTLGVYRFAVPAHAIGLRIRALDEAQGRVPNQAKKWNTMRPGELRRFAKAQRLTAAMVVGVAMAAASESELASLA